MKSLSAVVMALTMVVSAGCRTVPMNASSVSPSTSMVGASTPKGAVEMMLTAAKMQDIQAMSAVWGDEKGMTRDRIDRAQLETRALAMICLLRPDTQKIGEPQQLGGGHFQISADLTQGTNSASTMFTVAQSSAGRWLVSDVAIIPLQNKGFCPRR